MVCDTKGTTIFTFASDSYLAIAQDDAHSIFVYKYGPTGFAHYHNISSEGAKHVSSFKVGFKTYIAVSGYRAGIYEMTKRGIYRRSIGGDHKQFEDVDMWLPIPIKTYRYEKSDSSNHSL